MGASLTIARCDVVDDGPLVAVRPGVPLEFNSVSSVGARIETSSSSALVAVDVCCPNGVWLNETEVLVQGVPSCCLGTRIFGVVVPDRVGAFGRCAPDVDVLHEAVG